MEIPIDTNALRLLNLDVTDEQNDLILDVLAKEYQLGYEKGLKEGIDTAKSIMNIINGG